MTAAQIRREAAFFRRRAAEVLSAAAPVTAASASTVLFNLANSYQQRATALETSLKPRLTASP